MLKAYKYRLYPNKEQQEYFAKCFGCVRFIYNRMLSDKIEHYKETKQKLNNTPAQYKKEFPWLKEVDSLALANAQMNLQSAYNNFFSRPEVGFPKFKSKKSHYYSYKTNNQNGSITISDRYIKLPKIGLVKVKKHRDFEGIIKSVAVSKTPSGKYYVSVLVDCKEQEKLPKSENEIGIDLGIKEFAITSDPQNIKTKEGEKGMESRVEKTIELHRKGYNCAQAVACAYCDLVGVDEETMFKMAEGFGAPPVEKYLFRRTVQKKVVHTYVS